MEEFRRIRLGDACITNADSYSMKENWRFVNYLDTGNITNNKLDSIQRIDLSKEKLPSRARRKVRRNSIIYSTVRPNQYHFGIIKTQPENFLVSTGFVVIDVDPEMLDADFTYYWLSQSVVVKRLHAIAEQSTSAYPSIKSSDIENLEMEIPALATQKKIADVLRALDEKIAVNEEINKNLLQQLHVLYLRLFCDSAMDTPLGDVVATTSGGTPSRKHVEYYSDCSICWVKSKELLGNYIHETEEHINDLAIKKSSAKLLPEHSVLIAMYGATVGAYGVISKPMTCNQAVCALLCNENYPHTYLFQIACESQQKFINLAVGSAQQNISQVLIKQLNLHSDLDIIQRFHYLALPMHQKIECLQAENIRLSVLRDNLLPKLMSGELDVSNIDR